jgi:hypothetical protein
MLLMLENNSRMKNGNKCGRSVFALRHSDYQ